MHVLGARKQTSNRQGGPPVSCQLHANRDALGYRAGDTNLYRFVADDPINKVDPSGLETTTASKGLPPGGKSYPGYYHGSEAPGENPMVDTVNAFKKACADNGIDPKIVKQILDATVKTPKPQLEWDACIKWTQAADAKLPDRGIANRIPGGKGIIAQPCSWDYESCPASLWNVFVDSHAAIEVILPDGQVFYFDDGNWGGAFQGDKVPPFAKKK